MSKKRGNVVRKKATRRKSSPAPTLDAAESDSPEATDERGGLAALALPTKDDFFLRHHLSDRDLEQHGLTWDTLIAICEHHLKQFAELENTADFIASRIRRHPAVHSVKARVKDPEHLVEKVIRKRRENPKRLITLQNYEKEITDLIGIRVLHLFKGDWLAIHRFIKTAWGLSQTPIAYVRRGDPTEVETGFQRYGCNVREHDMGYRSVHYLIKSQPAKKVRIAELQVRTIFEEGWSEIDHRIRYPYTLNNAVLNQFLGVFNGLAGSADEMGTFIQTLRGQLAAWEADRESERLGHAETMQALTSQISKLEIDSKEKKQLEKKVKELESHTPRSIGSAIGGILGESVGSIRIGASAIGSLASPSILSQTLGSTNIVARRCAKCGKVIPFGTLLASSHCLECSAGGGLTRD